MSPRRPLPKKPNVELFDEKNVPVHAEVTVRSASGKSIHEKGVKIDSKTVSRFFPAEGADTKAIEILSSLGLRIVSHDKITICISAPREKFEEIFGVELTLNHYDPYDPSQKNERRGEPGAGIYFQFKEGWELPVPDALKALVDQINLSVPIYYFQNPNPPSPAYFHQKVPEDIARLVDAVQCHNHNINGAGIKIAIPDAGTFSHPYYTARGYNITVDESTYDGDTANASHGTAIMSNALAVAPGAEIIAIRQSSTLSNGIPAFIKAKELNPHIISVSWGTNQYAPNLRASVSLAIANGITVCAACGNNGNLAFPSSMPEVISVGGTYADAHDVFSASSFASSGVLTNLDPARQMPDLTGFSGQKPYGIYITLPCQPGSNEDLAHAGGTFPNGDETASDDGWLLGSGTSSAAPQVAGVIALLLQNDPALVGHPALIKQRLMDSAVDVTTGASANNQTAAPGVDDATGMGVVDAFRAMNGVDVWIKDYPEDTGLVPIHGLHYISPDIKVCSSELQHPQVDFDAVAHIDQPSYGQTYYVYIKTRNRGWKPATGIMVNFYYADPTVLASFPADWNDGQSSFPENGSIMVGSGQTNEIMVSAIPKNSFFVAGPFIWQPPKPTTLLSAAPDGVGNIVAHFCLLTRLECNEDPITFTSGSESTVWKDNNIGMKNLWVIEPDTSSYLFVGGTPDAKESKLVIEAEGDFSDKKMVLTLPSKQIHPANKKNRFVSVRRLDKRFTELTFSKAKGITQFEIRLMPKPKELLWFKISPLKQGQKITDKISVKIGQYANGQCVGGAGFLINKK